MSETEPGQGDALPRERLLRVLAGITFLIFFQAYMVAPMIPHGGRCVPAAQPAP